MMTTPRLDTSRLAVWLALALGAGCGTSPEADTNTWTVTGTLADPGLAGGTALALSSAGEVVSAPIEANGAFSLPVSGGATYAVHFLKDDAFVAVLYFQKNRWSQARTNRLQVPASALGAPAPGFRVVASEAGDAGAGEGDDIDLGSIEVNDGQANPENNPGEGLDADGDGVPDIDDEDDDNDGVPDNLEKDEDIDDSALGFLVKKIDPEPGDDEVDPEEAIEVELNRAFDPASITAETVALTDADGAPVPAVLVLDDEGEELEIVPTSPLLAGREYTVRIGAGVTSAGGEPLAAPFSSSFRIESEDDDDDDDPRLRIEEIEPEHGEDDVELDAEIEIEFNHRLDPTTVAIGEGGVMVLDAAGAAVSGAVIVDDEKVAFVPDASLAPHSEYSIVVGNRIASHAGESLSAALELRFATGAADDDEEEEEEEEEEDEDEDEDED